MFLEINEAPARAAFPNLHRCRKVALAPPAQDTSGRDSIAFGNLFDVKVEGVGSVGCSHVGLQRSMRGDVQVFYTQERSKMPLAILLQPKKLAVGLTKDGNR